MTEHRRHYLTPYWQRLAQRWLATVIFSLALTTLVCGLGGFSWQHATIAEAQRIAERAPMPLFLADIHLHRAHMFRDRDELATAAQLIRSFGYGR